MSEASDWELVAQVQAGDREAFARLVQRYQAPVVHFCHRMVRSHHDAQDLAQESFIRLYRSIGRLRPDAKFSTVLFGIARNLTLNFIRDAGRRGRYPGRPESDPEWHEQRLEDGKARPDRMARIREIEDVIERALALLSPDHREIIVLRELSGLDYEAIARVMGCRKGTVKSRLARAREQLRLRVIELGGELL